MDGARHGIHRSLVARARFQNLGEDHSRRSEGRGSRVKTPRALQLSSAMWLDIGNAGWSIGGSALPTVLQS